VGNLDKIFHHAIGDFDYSLRAKKNGIVSWVTGEYVACCDNNSSLPEWCLPETPLFKRLQNLYSPLGNSQPGPYFVYVKRHFGLVAAIKSIIKIHIQVLRPGLWK
jgi:GT2 family glycosyltransferase